MSVELKQYKMLLEWRIAVAKQLAVATAVARTGIIEPILDGIYIA